MAIIRVVKDKSTPWFITSREAAQNSNLTYRARGILWYLLSKPDGWEWNEKDLIKNGQEGRDAIRTALAELKDQRYLIITRERDPKTGMFGYVKTVHEHPVDAPLTENQEAVTPVTEKPLPGKPSTENQELETRPHNKDRRSTTERVNTEERGETGERAEGSAPASRAPRETSSRTQATATVEIEPTQQSARTPSPSSAAPSPALPTGTPTPVSAGQAPRDVEQPRLVDAEMTDALTVYRQVAGVRAPNQAQRAAIREHVTSDLDLWRESCAYFARNSFNVRKIDNVLDHYQKAVKTRRAEETARKEAEERRRQATAPREEITPEQWERIRAAGAELKAKLARQQAEEAARPRYEYLVRHRARAS